MGKHFQTARKGTAETRAYSAEESPRTIARQSAMGTQDFAVKSNPVAVKPDDRSIYPILIYGGAGHHVGAQEGVSDVGLPAIVLEHALDALGLRSGSGRQKRGLRENCGHEHILRHTCR